MLCGVEIVNTLTSAAPARRRGTKVQEHSPFRGLWDEGNGVVARRVHFPPFQGGVAAPLIRRSRSLAAQTGWFVISNKIRIATQHIRRLRDFLLTTPAAARPPLL